jgi:hypothetical protein
MPGDQSRHPLGSSAAWSCSTASRSASSRAASSRATPFNWKSIQSNWQQLWRALMRMRKLRAAGASLRAISDKMKAAGVSITYQGVKNALTAANRPASG